MIYFNNTPFDVEVDEISRRYEKRYAYDVTTQDGIRHVKVSNIKLSMDLQLVTMEPEIYSNLLAIFKTKEPYVDVKIEDEVNGDLEFTALNPEPDDQCEFYDDNQVYWGSLRITLEEK